MPTESAKPTSLFLHVPKSGGTALARHLRGVLGEANVFHVEDSHYQHASPEILLRRYPVVMGHFLFAQIPEQLFETTFLFTFLREPVDRTISLYHFLKGGDMDHAHRVKLGVHETLDAILAEWSDGRRCSIWSNWQTFLFSGATTPDQPAEDLLPAALRNLERFDFVGIQERYAEGVEALSRRRGWPLSDAPVQRFKASRDRPAVAQLDPALAEHIRAVNRCDERLYARARELWEKAKTFTPAAAPVEPPRAAPAPAPGVLLRRSEQGTREITFSRVETVDARTGKDAVIEQGNPVEIRLGLYSQIAADDLNVGIRISDELGMEVYGVSTRALLGRSLAMTADTTLDLSFALDLILAPGGYHLTVAIHGGDEHLPKIHHWIDDVTVFWCVRSGPAAFAGLVDLRATLTVDGGAGGRIGA